MNIFALHSSPKITARWHVDKHVVKMILESTQLLSNAYYIATYRKLVGATSQVKYDTVREKLNTDQAQSELDKVFEDFPRESPYRFTHHTHPCTIWSAYCKENWEWLLQLGKELCREYTHRYSKQHACAPLLQWMTEHHPVLPESSSSQATPFPLVMPERFQITEDPIRNYRILYTFGKKHLHKWTGRETPFFINSYKQHYKHAV